ncbi:MarR family winged helix-turn-helix transcriptional regulator [Amycolatopsis nigrescens]|uniref:MarR family winged helix-turn-helix transcriptional regulator n=1 Tax=Amycolatopsis nigrescens TaxID=381445 RepID=UPI0003AB01DA|nr:MarR family transcriptional regulator [Amycolatopsis nigrescens]
MTDVSQGREEPSSDGVDAIQREWLRERPETPVDSIGVITRIWWIGKLLDDDRRETMLRLGMDAATRDLLSALRRSGEPYRLAAGELAKRLMVSPGAISQRVSRAERDGYVRRVPSAADGRGVLVELTEEGHALIERTVDDLLRHEEDLLSSLSGAQRGQLSDLLRVLLADLTRRAG